MNGSEQWDGKGSSYNCHFKQNIQGEMGGRPVLGFFVFRCDSRKNRECGSVWLFMPFGWKAERFAILDKDIKKKLLTEHKCKFSGHHSDTAAYLLTLELFFPRRTKKKNEKGVNDSIQSTRTEAASLPLPQRAPEQDLMALWSDEGSSPVVKKPFRRTGH